MSERIFLDFMQLDDLRRQYGDAVDKMPFEPAGAARWVSTEDYSRMVRAATPKREEPEGLIVEPSITELAGNFVSATTRWLKAKAPVVTRVRFDERLATCQSCENWRGGVFAHCAKCGCTSLKLWLGTEKCPLGKWV